ncbi:MAG: acyltransferase family protein [Alphaproteobacteria bacterium]|nr:acyltransferase family protein [Alphaproteobacteria bacterium]
MTVQTSGAERYHALDSLRAAMMFLGIYLHCAVAYATVGGWPLRLPPLTDSLVWSMSLIHVFRMPLFYAMAGFFAAMLLRRYGARGAAINRFSRIVVPFVLGLAIVWPLVVFIAGVALYGIDRTVLGFQTGRVLMFLSPLHLWFLEYLIVLYVLAAVVMAIVPRVLSPQARSAIVRVFGSIVGSLWAPLVLAIPSFAAQLLMPDPWIEDPPGFIPAFRIVAVYAVPFGFGWLLFHRVDLLDVLNRRAWLYAALAVVASVAYRWSYHLPADAATVSLIVRAVHSLDMWLLNLGVAGLFLRYLSGHSALRRYLCDSSYFLYIAHMPVIMAFQLLLRDLAVPPVAKVFLVLAGSIIVLLPLYHYAVRPTAIGALLNGRRYPSRPALAVA